MTKVDAIRLEVLPSEDAPTRAQWSFSDRTPCGIKAFQRPCQLRGASDPLDGSFPNDPLCASSREFIYVVEDDDDLRSDLIEMVSDMGYDAIGCPSSDAFQRTISGADTGCIVLDIKLQGGDGLSILERMKQANCTLPAIMLTGMQDPLVAAECIKTGAIEYIVKPANEIVLRRAIDRAIGLSRSNFCRQQSQRFVRGLLGQLTPAEKTVAEMLAKGYTTKQIAGNLNRSENTVKIHRHRLMTKLNVNSVASVANIYSHVPAD